jgi:hypothetical protein
MRISSTGHDWAILGPVTLNLDEVWIPDFRLSGRLGMLLGNVREVDDVMSLSQEVSVPVVEVNDKAWGIVLTMRDKESEAEQSASRSGDELGASSGSQQVLGFMHEWRILFRKWPP